ncbi:type III secretion system domain-containing protein [Pandoraea pneumonica]|uniref:type III secretion system domain-containing protein n=1 Tax=Pandoraea pneumonica TaxID=2508299 RepID=UPI003CF16D1E
MTSSPRALATPTALTQLARLIWQPGRYMDERWWRKFDMSALQYVYQHRLATRAAIDRQLNARRGWPNDLSELGTELSLSDTACATLRLVPNVRRVALAYGLHVMGCPDYLLFGDYRRVLVPWLDAWQCDRLLLARRDWPTPGTVPPEKLVDTALATTVACLDETPVNASPDVAVAHRAMRVLLPPSDSSTHPDLAPAPDVWSRLVALEKMLCMSSTIP